MYTRKINATFLRCGRPLVAWQADVMGHSREFASLMAQMGFDGLFVSFDDEIARMRRKGMEFIWRGSDDLGQLYLKALSIKELKRLLIAMQKGLYIVYL
jgi:hypothetical protein